MLNGKRYELTGSWRGSYFDWRAECEGRLVAASFDLDWVRQRCEADSRLCWCGEAIERPKCEGCDD